MPAVDEMAIGLLELFVNKCKKGIGLSISYLQDETGPSGLNKL